MRRLETSQIQKCMHETSRDVTNPCMRRLEMRRLETSHRTLYGSRLFCSKVGGRWAQRANADAVEADLRNGGCASKTFWSLFTAVFASKKKESQCLTDVS